MEKENKINWLSLFIKIVIIFIFIIIVIWLVSKLIGRNNLSEKFVDNINNMQEVSLNYFKKIDLPLEKGKSIKITLKEMIEKEMLVLNEDLKNSCDLDNSYSKITREKDNYKVETKLECGKENDTITTKFELKDCQNCNAGSNKEDNSSNNDKNEKEEVSSSEENASKVTYYEHVKETVTYTKWMRGSKEGSNIENRYEYYGTAKDEYYSLGIINKNDIEKNTITYTLKLDKVPNSKYYFTTIKESSYYNSNEKKEYINENKISINDDIEINKIEKYSLKEENFSYKLSPYYRKGNFYVDVTVNIKNIDNLESYYDAKTKKEIYLVPIKFIVKFASNIISEEKPAGDYETISYYRYVETNREVIWSTEEYVEGYTKTGNTKIK